MKDRFQLISVALRGSLQLTLQIGLALVLVIVLQFTASRFNHRFDLTPTRAFLLSPYADQVARSVGDDVEITAFYDGQTGDQRRMLDLLQQFTDANPRISFRLVDLDQSPALGQTFGVSNYDTGVMDSGGQRLTLRSISEPEIVTTLLTLTRATPHRICVVTGHGERSPADRDERRGLSELVKSLEAQRFAIHEINTVATGVPKGCFIVVIAGPTHQLLDGEGAALTRFLHGGGRALLMIDPETPASFVSLLRDLGVEAGNNVIVDEANRMVGADSFVVQVLRFRPDVFQDHLRTAAILPIARAIRAAEERPPDTEIIAIAGTSEDSWAHEGTTEIPDQSVRFDRDKDEAGPLSVAVLVKFEATSPGDQQGGRMIVFGDSDFATNSHFGTLGNADLITAAFAVLAEDPVLIASGKTQRGDPSPQLALSDKQTRVIFWTAFLLLPGLSLLFGLAVVRWRRHQRGGR